MRFFYYQSLNKLGLIVCVLCMLSLRFTLACADVQMQNPIHLNLDTGNKDPEGLPSMTVYIQGKKRPVIVDTGSQVGGLALTENALKGIRVKYTGKKTCFSTLDEQKMCFKEFIIPDLRLGSFHVKKVHGYLVKKIWGIKGNSFFYHSRASRNGVIGYDILSKYNALFDFAHHRLTLYDHGGPHHMMGAEWVTLPVHAMYSSLRVHGKLHTFYWDTGSMPSVVAAGVLSEARGDRCLMRGSHQECARFRSDDLELKDHQSFPAYDVDVESGLEGMPFDFTLGTNLFLHHKVFFNFKSHRVSIEK